MVVSVHHHTRKPILFTQDDRLPSAEFQVDDPTSTTKPLQPAAVAATPPAADPTIIKKKKKSVSFCQTVAIRLALHMNDMTDDEIENTWYGPREFARIKYGMATTVKMKVAGKLSRADPTQYTWRGLEYRTRAGSAERKLNKARAINAVMDEQDLQDQRGIVDEDALARVYIASAGTCSQVAALRGYEDEIECMEINRQEMQHEVEEQYNNNNEEGAMEIEVFQQQQQGAAETSAKKRGSFKIWKQFMNNSRSKLM